MEEREIIKILEDKKLYHAEQLNRINIAIEALKGITEEGAKTLASNRVNWSTEILKVVPSFGGGMTPADIRQKLAERGISKALDDGHKSTIYATLSRLAKNNKLRRTEEGVYFKQRQSAPSEDR